MGRLITALKLKCPRCENGRLYEKSGVFQRKGMFSMITNCSNCGLKYEKEIGYFYGAMYISYMINMALFIAATVAYYVVLDQYVDWRLYIFAYVLFTVFITKYIYRLSRSFWLMIMIDTDLGAINKTKADEILNH